MAFRLFRRFQFFVLLSAFLLILTLTGFWNQTNFKGQLWLHGEQPGWATGFTNPNGGHVRWKDVPDRNPLSYIKPLPSGPARKLAKVQFDFKPETQDAAQLRSSRQAEIKKTFQRCWKAYKAHAWLKDELAPISRGYKSTFGGWAATLVDSLDTLWIMGLKPEFNEAVSALSALDFSPKAVGSRRISVFETNIRYLGGLLSAYDLSGDKRLLDKAIELGDLLLKAFDTPNRMPIAHFTPVRILMGELQTAGIRTLVAEIGSLSLEFTHLSQLTGNPKWYDAVHRITRVFHAQQAQTQLPGLFPIVVDPENLNFTESTMFSLGAMADSMYEYFPKMYALLGGTESEDTTTMYASLYLNAMDAAIENLLFHPMTPSNAPLLMPGVARVYKGAVTLDPEAQHLACFAGGMFALGGKLFGNATHVDVGRSITDACVWAYRAAPLGIMPETFNMVACPRHRVAANVKPDRCEWDQDAWYQEVILHAPTHDFDAQRIIAEDRLWEGVAAVRDRRYVLRPEAIESVFVLYRITGDERLVEMAWDMWRAVDATTRVAGGNAAIKDVTVSREEVQNEDSMESFWLAETVKYFYLMFSDTGLLSLDEWVLNTEAHPFRRPTVR